MFNIMIFKLFSKNFNDQIVLITFQFYQLQAISPICLETQLYPPGGLRCNTVTSPVYSTFNVTVASPEFLYFIPDSLPPQYFIIT